MDLKISSALYQTGPRPLLHVPVAADKVSEWFETGGDVRTNPRTLTTLVLLAVSAAACGSTGADPSQFDYDSAAPLQLVIGDLFEASNAPQTEIHAVTFAGADGKEVTGLIADPPEGQSPKAVLLLHGVSQGAPIASNDMVEPMRDWSCAGATTLAIDMPYARLQRFDSPFTETESDAEEAVQLIVDLRRSVDLLIDRGSSEVAFVAISGGAVFGATFVGVEDRLAGSVLLVGNGGPWHRWSEFGVPSVMMMGMTDEERDSYAEIMGPYSGTHFVGDHNAPILFINGRLDPIIGEDAAQALHDAAGEDIEVSWYESGHDLPPEGFIEAHDWVGDVLGLDPERVADCQPVFS
jgi:predicted alpha/beta-hydrolase family hydrolase